MMNRVCMGTLATILMMAHPAAAEPVGRGEKRQVRDALELFYLDRGIYDPVRCRVEDGGEPERTWAFCAAVGGDSSIGGLYMVAPSEGNTGVVWAINGKAIQHIGDGAIQIGDIRQNAIVVTRWMGEPINIGPILAIFE
ncbi:hypothetical protein [Paracoccus sp. 22332]|uniref:hypothetical protein n=1 Tax=Paracoccus sp. 22332 TaxID=3453913 RepID=UPI003F86F6FF